MSASWKSPVSEFKKRQRHLPHLESPGSWYFTTSATHERLILTPEIRDVVLSTIRLHAGQKYTLAAAVVMPDHFHLLIRPQTREDGTVPLAEIFHSIKSFSARKAEGRLWQRDNYDHIVRSEIDFREKLQYIVNNPVKASLVERADEYQWLFVASGISF